MRLFNFTPLLLILAVCFTAVNSMSFSPFRRDESCGEDLFESLKELRDNMIVQAVIADVVAELSVNNAELATLACQIVEAVTIEELATVLKLPAQDLETKLRALKASSQILIGYIHFYEVEFNEMRSWMVESGFPDFWPLRTNYQENLDFLLTCEMQHSITFGTEKTKNEVASILTDCSTQWKSKSLKGYLKALEVNTSERLDSILERIRYLPTEEAGQDITKAAQAGVQFIEAVLDLQVVKALGQ